MEKKFKIPYDESIEIDSTNLPNVLKNIMKELEDLYKKDDWFNYDLKYDLFEVKLKQCVLNGLITDNEYYKLIEKYGGLYD